MTWGYDVTKSFDGAECWSKHEYDFSGGISSFDCRPEPSWWASTSTFHGLGERAPKAKNGHICWFHDICRSERKRTNFRKSYCHKFDMKYLLQSICLRQNRSRHSTPHGSQDYSLAPHTPAESQKSDSPRKTVLNDASEIRCRNFCSAASYIRPMWLTFQIFQVIVCLYCTSFVFTLLHKFPSSNEIIADYFLESNK